MKVLMLPIPTLIQPWIDDVVSAIGDRHEVVYIDPQAPLCCQLDGVDVVIDHGGRGGTPALIDAAAEAGVKLWQILGTGLDDTDVDTILAKGLVLANVPGEFSAISLAEHTLFLMLLFAKRYHESQDSIRNQILCLPTIEELNGKTLGLVGLGASARHLAKLAWPLGMHIMAIDITNIPRKTIDEYHIEFFGDPSRLDHLLSESDYLSLHIPLNTKTHHLIGHRELDLMKTTAVLINVSRGELVNETALVEALREGRIRGAAFDTFSQEPVDPSHPLVQLDNFIATPHLGGVTWETSRRRAEVVAENIERIAGGLPPLYQVNSAE